MRFAFVWFLIRSHPPISIPAPPPPSQTLQREEIIHQITKQKLIQAITSDYSSSDNHKSCQSEISNQCRINKPCITAMAKKSFPLMENGGDAQMPR